MRGQILSLFILGGIGLMGCGHSVEYKGVVSLTDPETPTMIPIVNQKRRLQHLDEGSTRFSFTWRGKLRIDNESMRSHRKQKIIVDLPKPVIEVLAQGDIHTLDFSAKELAQLVNIRSEVVGHPEAHEYTVERWEDCSDRVYGFRDTLLPGHPYPLPRPGSLSKRKVITTYVETREPVAIIFSERGNPSYVYGEFATHHVIDTQELSTTRLNCQ